MPAASLAGCVVRRCSVVPSRTSASNTLVPSSCALAKAPSPASQICCADCLTVLARSLSNRLPVGRDGDASSLSSGGGGGVELAMALPF